MRMDYRDSTASRRSSGRGLAFVALCARRRAISGRRSTARAAGSASGGIGVQPSELAKAGRRSSSSPRCSSAADAPDRRGQPIRCCRSRIVVLGAGGADPAGARLRDVDGDRQERPVRRSDAVGECAAMKRLAVSFASSDGGCTPMPPHQPALYRPAPPTNRQPTSRSEQPIRRHMQRRHSDADIPAWGWWYCASNFSFLAISSKLARLQLRRHERSAVISRRRAEAAQARGFPALTRQPLAAHALMAAAIALGSCFASSPRHFTLHDA